jgi:hypothetical protein
MSEMPRHGLIAGLIAGVFLQLAAPPSLALDTVARIVDRPSIRATASCDIPS